MDTENSLLKLDNGLDTENINHRRLDIEQFNLSKYLWVGIASNNENGEHQYAGLILDNEEMIKLRDALDEAIREYNYKIHMEKR